MRGATKAVQSVAEIVVLRLGPNTEEIAHWIIVDSNGTRLSPPMTGELSAAQADIGGRKLMVLVPSADVLTTTVDLPLKAQAKIQQALPFALEEFLADDVEDLHFAAGPRRESGRIPVSIVNREKFDAWLGVLQDAGLSPDAVIADTYGLACIPGTISVLIAADQVIINDGDDTELVLPGVGPADALSAIGAFEQTPTDDADELAEDSDKRPSRHVLIYCEPGAEETYKHDFNVLRHDFESVDIKLLSDGELPRMAVTVAAGSGVNLLQGGYGAKTEYAALFRPWRIAATLLLAFGATAVSAKALDYWQLSQRETALREQFVTEYQAIAPGTDDVRDPLAIITSLRNRTGTTSAPAVFLQALDQLSKATQQNSSASIQAISYRAGVVDLRISAPTVSILDAVQRQIDAGGTFEAEIKTTDQDDDKVNSRIQIKATGQ